jgi:aspartate/methionine/tyrosine aminotransferase
METLTPFAVELNEQIRSANPIVADLLSSLGRRIYLPKGILSQSAEAAQRASRFNATRAIALENGGVMHLSSSHQLVPEIDPNLVYGYAPTLGQMELRLRWKARLEAENPSLKGKAFSLPIVTCGLTHGFSLIGDLFVNPGDTLVIPDKIWGNYRLIFQTKCGAEIQTYSFYNARRQLNTSGFRETLRKISQTTGKLIVLLNFPHNPTGFAITAEEAAEMTQAITEVAASGCRLLVLVDDAYFGLWYDDNALRESIFGWLVDAHPNVLAIKIDGATKEEYAWGLRVGFLTCGLDGEAMKGLEDKMTGLIRANTSGASQLSQTLVLQAMDSPQYTLEKSQKYEILKCRALRVRAIAAHPRYAHLWDVYPFNAGYFMCLRLKSANAETVRQQLLDECGIGVIAIGDTDLRVAFSCIETSEIDEVFHAIAQVAIRVKCDR